MGGIIVRAVYAVNYLLICLIISSIAAFVNAVDYSAQLRNARKLVKERRYGEALTAFSKILDSPVLLGRGVESKLKAEAASEAGEVLVLLGQFDDAIAQLKAAKSFLKESDTPSAFRQEMEPVYAYRLANCYALAGKWQEAEAGFESFIESQDSDTELHSAAQTKLEWIKHRIFSRSRPTIRFTASLLAFLLAISLCFYIFVKDPLSYLNLSLSFFLFSFALWQFADAIRINTLTPDIALFWSKALLAGIFLVCLANLNFIILFLRRHKREDFGTSRWLFLGLPPATLIMVLPSNLYTQGVDLFYWHWEQSFYGLIHRLFLIYLTLYVIYGITMVTRTNLAISKGTATKPIKYMFFTITFISMPLLAAVVLVPFSRHANYLIGVSSLTVIVMVAGLIYSIRRYRIIDVNAVLSRSLAYFALTGLLLGLYVLLVNLFSGILQGFFKIQTSFWVYVAATLIVAILFQPAKNRIQSFIDRLSHKGQDIYQQTLLDFSQAITSILNLDHLCRLLVSTVTDAMKIDRGWLLIEKDDGDGYEMVASVGLDETKKQIGEDACVAPTISIPLQKDEHTIGVLKLGQKYSGKPFTKKDREILEILANQAAVAIANARLVEQLRRTEQLKMLGQLSAGIAHEVRNPLLTIKGAAQYLQSKFKEESEEDEFASIIVEESDRINQLIAQFLDYARPAKPELQPMDVTECLDRTLTLVNVELRHAKIELVRDYAHGLSEVLGDKKQLGQVFLNLILNAIEAMPNGGTLRIQTTPERQIQISDTGVGMSTEEQERIFEPFYTGKEHGLGLGLAIVKEIVSEHGGAISVESEKGKGTTFTIILKSM